MSYTVRVVKFANGERFAHLIVLDTQLPHFLSTAYNLSMLRGRALATSTIEQALRAIKIFLLFCDERGIALSTRMQDGFMFKDGELDDLLRLCRKPLANLKEEEGKSKSSRRTLKMRRAIPDSKSEQEVGKKWIEKRITYIRDYIDWMADNQCCRLSPDHEYYLPLLEKRKSTYNKLTQARPVDKGRNVVNQRRSLTEEQQEILLRIIEPSSSENIWKGRHCRLRNKLMVEMFIKLGIRRGELGGISVRDINFKEKTLLIVRRADDENDPRENQPNAKTRDRILPLTDYLLKLIQNYVICERKKHRRAREHPFLFVANGGHPLGLRAINKVFESLAKCDIDFKNIHPHILRHTFNANLSISMDANKTSEAEEERVRSELNGWKPCSGTSTTYLKRIIERKARAALLALQGNQPIKPINNEY